ncbi:hypothetical protein RB195_016966 [Necator americanus]
MELTSRWLYHPNSGSCSSEHVSDVSSSAMSDSSHSSTSNDSVNYNRTLSANSQEEFKLCRFAAETPRNINAVWGEGGTTESTSFFERGELQKGYVEVPIHSDVLFVNLPGRIVSALVQSRRIVVEGDGKIRSLPFALDEFNNLAPHTDDGINPLQRRVLHALEKETSTKTFVSCDQADKGKENEENNSVSDNETSGSLVDSTMASLSLASSGASKENEVSSIDSKGSDQKDLLCAIGLSSDQIDRLYNAPVWTPMLRKKSEDEEEESTAGEDQSMSADPSERSWEIAAILRPQITKKGSVIKEKEYLVVWKDWPWYDQWSLTPESFDGDGKRMAAADTRERLVSQMAAYMQQKDKKGFDEMFPSFGRRHDFTNWYRVHLRVVEQAINDELEDLGMAPIYIENWTNDERALINVKYLTRCALSVLNYREVKATGRSLRLQYPDEGAGCNCKDGICTSSCPCIKLMGRDQIRMRSSGKVDVEKLAEATTVECGTTCSCTSDCPSRFAERGRKVPLVVMYTTAKGWSVFAPQIIPAGTFLGVYTGEIIPLCSAISQGISTSYQFTNIHQIPGTKQYVVDASRMGNETRYFNHACGDAANLKAVSLLSRGNLLTNNMLFFTKRMIAKGEELTFSYRGKDMEEQKSGIRCLCTPGCQNRL